MPPVVEGATGGDAAFLSLRSESSRGAGVSLPHAVRAHLTSEQTAGVC